MAARCDTLATFEREVRLEVGGRLHDVGRADHPADPPAGHGVGLGHAVHDDAAVGQLGDGDGDRGELVVAVGEVLVDLVGEHPDAVLDGPLADGLDLLARGRPRRSGSTATRRRAALVRVGAGRLELVDGDPEAGGLVGRQLDHRAAGEAHGLGVGRPVRRREQHLVAGVDERGDGVVDGVLAAVGDDDLRRGDLVAGVPQRLRGDGLLQLGQAAGRRVAVVARVAAGRDGGLDDVVGRREVGLAGAEADDRLARRLQRLGLGVDRQRGGLGDGTDSLGDAPAMDFAPSKTGRDSGRS